MEQENKAKLKHGTKKESKKGYSMYMNCFASRLRTILRQFGRL